MKSIILVLLLALVTTAVIADDDIGVNVAENEAKLYSKIAKEIIPRAPLEYFAEFCAKTVSYGKSSCDHLKNAMASLPACDDAIKKEIEEIYGDAAPQVTDIICHVEPDAENLFTRTAALASLTDLYLFYLLRIEG